MEAECLSIINYIEANLKESLQRNMARSKRKQSESEQSAKAKKKRSTSGNKAVYQDNSVFGQLVLKAGIALKAGSVPYQLSEDPAVFQRNLTLSLKRHADYPDVIDEFNEGFSKHMDDPIRFHQSLLPVVLSEDMEISRMTTSILDSLTRLLLGVELVQAFIMNLLLEKLAELTGDEDAFPDNGEKVDIPKLIMNQFRWLDRIVNSKDLVEKMFEILSVTSLEVQREIITCIPEVIEDIQHPEVARQLRDMLMENNALAVPILDAMSNLSLQPELLSEVRGSVVQTLPSVGLDDLPVIVKFLLQTVTSNDAYEVVSELRSHLDFRSSIKPNSSSTPNIERTKKKRDGDTQRSERGSEALTVDAIRSAIRFQKTIAEAWIKAIENVKHTGDHQVVDVIVLLVLHSTNHKRPVESLLRNKLRAGLITEVLLQATFGSHGQVLREYFPSVLAIAEALLRSPEPAISYFASVMYKQAFKIFDAYCQQEIVGSLVAHIGSGSLGEIGASLDVLADLVESDIVKMAPFAIFVKGVLDYLEHLSVPQIRKLYAMLSILAFRNPRDEGMIQDEMHIIIRKQLSNNNPKYQRMGVIGAIMVVKSLAYSGPADTSMQHNASDVSDMSITEDMYKQVISLLQLVRASCARFPEASALFMDELSTVISNGGIDAKVEAWISDNVINDFQDDFVIDIDPKDTYDTDVLPMELQYGLDDEGEGSIAINLLPLVLQYQKLKKHPVQNQKDERVIAPLSLSPQFRLLQICEKKQHGGDLEGIDALLGCTMLLPKIDVVDKLDSLSQDEKEALCESLFLAINWFREVVNAFATQTDPEMKAKVITRLHNLTDLHSLLEKCLAATANFIPPTANFDIGEKKPIGGTSASSSGGKKGGRKPAKRGKKRKDRDQSRDESDESIRETTQMEKDTQVDKTQPEEKNDSVSDKLTLGLNQYRQYLRELDVDVFTVLQTGLITKAALDTEMNTKDTTTLQLQPAQLQYLLQDLVAKLEHALIASVAKRRTFLKTKGDKDCGFSHLDHYSASTVAKRVVHLLPALCQHLEGTSAFFQAIIAENDGVLDGPGHFTEEAMLMGSCFHLLLQAFQAFFAWTGFLMNENRPLLKEAFSVLAARVNSTATSQMAFQDLVRQAVKYLDGFAGTVPNLPAAVTVCKLLATLADKAESQQLTTKIGTVSLGFLKREWFAASGERQKGAKYNEQLQTLLKIFCCRSEDIIACLENIAAQGVPELLQTDKTGYSNTYPTLTRNSFTVFYRVMLSELVDAVKAIGPGKPADDEEVKMDKLIQWNLAVRVFHILVNLIKAFDARANLGAALKYGRQFLETFLRQGMPLLDHMFRNHKNDVQGLLKNLQISTRALHHMCGHSKIIKDVSLINQVPLLKKCLEMFVYRVKAMLTINKCLEAFWLGNLKNRDLQGEEIVSQASRVTENEDGSESDNLPDDDEDSEVEIEKQSEGSNDTRNAPADEDSSGESCSEIF